jgi:two-component system, LytTR family, sensor kinase
MKKIQNWWKLYYQRHRKSILFVTFFWLIYILFNVLLYYPIITDLKDLLRMLINYSSWGLLIFLPQYFILRKLLFRRKIFLAILAILLNISFYLLVRYFYNVYLFPEIGVRTPYGIFKFNFKDFFLDSAYFFMNNSILAYGYGFAKHAVDLEVRERKLTEANAKLQHQRDMTQIAFLQAQINPHFLYNTLNFIYSEAIMVSDSVAESIMTLSNIMRYTLTETGKDTLVSLYSEVNHIKNYLRLQKMRFSNELYLDLIVEGEENINHLEILPLVLISFVENIFKHGDIHDPDHPAKIVMNVEENSFYLSIYNRKNKGPKEHSSGVGMNNIRVRMDILYGEKYQVKILTDTEDEFALEFTISDMEEAFRNLKKYKILNQ